MAIGASATCLFLASAASGAEEPVDFQSQIRPLLSDRCFVCHGPDEESRQARLRLDRRATAIADRGGYAAIVPGDAQASELLIRMRDGSDPMPPAESKLTLSAEEIGLFERWIDGGAEYARHWSFVPPEAPEEPTAGDGWTRDPLDRFVRRTMGELEPAPEADRATWLRRVSFVLTGLPPSLGELDDFLADTSEDAHERVVDRLLASPRYAERMASDWLDAARYADTYGYQNDVGREVWPWRDWVVRAFQENLSYEEFVTWQLAGDLLDEPTRDQLLATTFNRLHRQTNEGGSVEEEFRVEYVSDRVHTFGMAFLGLTLECARCHDHKYDPISQRDYYGLAAFFDNIDESGLYSHFTSAVPTPALQLSTPDEDASIAALEGEILALERELARCAGGSTAEGAGFATEAPLDELARFDFESIEEGLLVNAIDAGVVGRVHDDPVLVGEPGSRALALSGEDNAHFPGVGNFARFEPFTIALRIRLPEGEEPMQRAVVLHRTRAWTDSGSRGYQLLVEEGRLSASLIHFWPGDAIRVKTREGLPRGEWLHVTLTYDGSSRAEGLQLFLDGRGVELEVVRDGLTRTIREGVDLTVGQRFRDYGFKGGQVDELRLFGRVLSQTEIRGVATGEGLAEVLAREPGLLGEHVFTASDPEAARLRAELRARREELAGLRDGIRQIMTMREDPSPRATRLLARGSYLSPGELVRPSTPPSISSFPDELPPDRLGLARWLFAEDHPLTARVAMNRLWRIAFGRGLVPSAEDFGNQGSGPLDRELLDRLAIDLRESGWDMRAMLKRLVLSATFRQSSRVSVEERALDPENLRLARASTPRLTAEMVRDQSLALSGLLVEEVGGAPVKPYQPEGLWKEKSGAVYQPDEGAGLWRRSLYTYWKRTSPPPSMMILDASKRDVCVARRRPTRSPMQVLLVWNDPQFVEAARGLAERLLCEVEGDRERLRSLWRRATSHWPADEELAVLEELLETARGVYLEDPSAAEALLGTGASGRAVELGASEHVAWTVVASTILAHDGALTLR